MRSFACLVLAAAAAASCADSAAPVLPPDAERDSAVGPDGSIFGDGPVGDAGPDSGTMSDGGADGGTDGGADGGADGGSMDGGTDGGAACDTSALCPSCPEADALCEDDDSCAAGEACIATGCGDLARCFAVGGGACNVDADCGDPAYECDQIVGRCLRSSPGCDDSNDCVPGFACEDDACVDRRVPCGSLSDCPHGYACRFTSPDQRFCRRITRPCGDDFDCLVLGVQCGDADGDGSRECMPSLDPNGPNPVSCDNAACMSQTDPVCEITLEGTRAVCGWFGLCGSSGACAEGFECRDLWGDGRPECVLPGGSCVDSSDCGPRQVCATPRAGGPPACVTGAAM